VAKVGEHAVVLGASIGGLLAARVLSDFYRNVTVVERDILPTEVAQRRGVPQGHHVHALWPRGSQILDDLFPGFLKELVDDGCVVWDDGDFSRAILSFGGHQFVRSGFMPKFEYGDSAYYPSRPFLEDHVRRRVRAVSNVTLMEGHDLVEFTSNVDGTRVTGVLVSARIPAKRKLLRRIWLLTPRAEVLGHRHSWSAWVMSGQPSKKWSCGWSTRANCCGSRPVCTTN
jgi:2-polyprenyl-6-methoxyphenol hydroxylase-like FAD-dependent oxidoreductase